MTTILQPTSSTHLGPHFISVSLCDSSYLSKPSADSHITGYIVWAYPHSWALQRLPVGKYLAANILLWAVFLGLQCLCTNFGGLCE